VLADVVVYSSACSNVHVSSACSCLHSCHVGSHCFTKSVYSFKQVLVHAAVVTRLSSHCLKTTVDTTNTLLPLLRKRTQVRRNLKEALNSNSSSDAQEDTEERKFISRRTRVDALPFVLPLLWANIKFVFSNTWNCLKAPSKQHAARTGESLCCSELCTVCAVHVQCGSAGSERSVA
jgi:hypothetical protein